MKPDHWYYFSLLLFISSFSFGTSAENRSNETEVYWHPPGHSQEKKLNPFSPRDDGSPGGDCGGAACLSGSRMQVTLELGMILPFTRLHRTAPGTDQGDNPKPQKTVTFNIPGGKNGDDPDQNPDEGFPDDKGDGGSSDGADGTDPPENNGTEQDDNHWNHLLLTAAQEGVVSVIEMALEQGAHVDFSNAAGETALFLAAMNDHLEAVEFLLSHQALPNIGPENGTVLDFLIPKICELQRSGESGNCLQIAVLLLDHGGDVKRKLRGIYFRVRDVEFMKAVIRNLKDYLEQGVTLLDENRTAIDMGPVHAAVAFGNEAVLDVVCQNFPNHINSQACMDGHSCWHPFPLNMAAYLQNSVIVRILLQNGARINRAHAYGIHYADGHFKSIDELQDSVHASPRLYIFAGSDDAAMQREALEQIRHYINFIRKALLDALKLSCKGHGYNRRLQLPIIMALIDPEAEELVDNGQNLLEICAEHFDGLDAEGQTSILEAMKILLDSGAGVSRTLLFRLTGEPQYLFAGTSVENPAETVLPCWKARYRPLYFAIRRGHSNAVRMLLALGANPNNPLWIKDGGHDSCVPTPLSFAAFHQNQDMVRVLLNAGASLVHSELHVQSFMSSCCTGELSYKDIHSNEGDLASYNRHESHSVLYFIFMIASDIPQQLQILESLAPHPELHSSVIEVAFLAALLDTEVILNTLGINSIDSVPPEWHFLIPDDFFDDEPATSQTDKTDSAH